MVSKKILIVTYYWPPSGGVGVQRWLNFALQLRSLGWDPFILTPENPQFEIKDVGQLDEVVDLNVYKVPIWEPFDFFHRLTRGKEKGNVQQGLVLEKPDRTFRDRLLVWVRGNLFVPDPRIFWLRRASREAVRIIREKDIESVITTGPPHSMHLIGRRVKRETGIHWLADFRDPWSKWDVLQKLRTSSLAMYLHKKLEKAVLSEADLVTTVSPRLAKSLGPHVEVLHNGITVKTDPTQRSDPSFYTIGYFGMLNELRNPSKLWLVLDQLCRERPDFATKLQLRIGGIVSSSIKEELGKLEQLREKIQFLGYLPHDQMLSEYRRCDLLLLLLNKSANAQWILPVKFFEYLAADRTILALGQRTSDLGDLMDGMEMGEIFSYAEVQQMRAFILAHFKERTHPNRAHVEALLQRFSHAALAKKLAAIIDTK